MNDDTPAPQDLVDTLPGGADDPHPGHQGGGEGPERTADGRYIVVRGRRWRATDPELPEEVARNLRSELGRARSAIGRAEDPDVVRAWRDRVQLAKEGLGERGQAWWEMTVADRAERARERLDRLRSSDPPA